VSAQDPGARFRHVRARAAIARAASAAPRWAIESLLDAEILTPEVWDPCCGTGTLTQAATLRGYRVRASDLHDWDYGETGVDFLTALPFFSPNLSFLMNPPFAKAVQFIEHAQRFLPRKIVCFQRFAWWESAGREAFWDVLPPNRVYVCRTRASCWRFDIPPAKRRGGTSVAHAWFVWERGQPPGTLIGHIDRPEGGRRAP
jgi:hypothetical protein